MKPILKYRGGKSREISFFEKFIPRSYNRYIEPFFGGGALFFHLEPKNAILNDINSKLMDCYNEIANNYDSVRSQLDYIHKLYQMNQEEYEIQKAKVGVEERVPNKNEALYYELRDYFNYEEKSKYYKAVTYFFINKTAYSGMIRYNRKGEYNVPFGRYKSFNTNLLTKEHSKLLQFSEIYNEGYKIIFEMAKEDDFMFLDPPYDTIFSDYGNENGFTEEEHKKLAVEFKKLKCKALMIIGKTPLIEELYREYIYHEATYGKNYAVNIRNRFKSEAEHIVIANYDVFEVAKDNGYVCEFSNN